MGGATSTEEHALAARRNGVMRATASLVRVLMGPASSHSQQEGGETLKCPLTMSDTRISRRIVPRTRRRCIRTAGRPRHGGTVRRSSRPVRLPGRRSATPPGWWDRYARGPRRWCRARISPCRAAHHEGVLGLLSHTPRTLVTHTRWRGPRPRSSLGRAAAL